MKRILASTALGVLSCCSAFFAILFPGMFIPFGLFSSVLFAFCIYFSGTSPRSFVIPMSAIGVTSLLIAFFTNEIMNALLAFVVFIPIGYAVGMSYHRKKSLNSAGGSALLFGTPISLIAYISYVYCSNYSFSIEAANEKLADAVSELFAPLTSVLVSVNLPSDVIDFYLFSAIPSYIAAWLLFATAVSYYVFSLCFKSSETDTSFITPFTDFHISRVGVILCSVLVIITSLTSSTVLFVVSMNFLIIEFAVTAYSGISTVCFFIDLLCIPKAVKIVLFAAFIVGSVAFSPLAVLSAILGLADTLFNFRNRIKNSAV